MVTRSAKFIFQHSHIGLKSHGKGRAAAAVNYQTNVRKCERILTVNLPGHNRHALKDHVQRYEDSLPRKDSRVAETFIIGFPLEMTAEHRELAAQRFLWRLTGLGRSRAWAVLHHNDPGNPHMHANLLDRDIETGKPVQCMTLPPKQRRQMGMDATGTDTARRIWEQAANSVFEEFGYEYRLDRRSLEKRMEALRAEPLAIANEGSPEVRTEGLPAEEEAAPSDAPTETLEEPATEEQAEALVEPEPDMAHENEQPEGAGQIMAGRPPETVVGKVQRFTQLHARLGELQAARQKLWDYQTAFEVAHRSYEQNKAALDAAISAADNAANSRNLRRVDMLAHQTASGRLKGLSLFGLKTRARKAAERAQSSLREAEDTYKTAERAYGRQALAVSRAQSETRDANSSLQEYEYQLARDPRYGTAQAMNRQESVLVNSEEQALKGLSGAQVVEAANEGLITSEEALEACRKLGAAEYVQMLEERLDVEQER